MTAAASTTNAISASSANTSPAPMCQSACRVGLAIGHTRYATAGGTILRNVQPLFADLAFGGFAVAHNGNLTNAAICAIASFRTARSSNRRRHRVHPAAHRQVEEARAWSIASSKRCTDPRRLRAGRAD
jgi:predicted glutamine amidotransferase